ncbi:MAG: hypothetical protein ACTSUP_04885 [Candidatus Heimdallarchaeaceae archaeon]|nr:hypothetical protein [Candidatus Heimdallarchaeota archaeon]MCK5304878.1 hypothetical protein [Candidatus Heimdallarchaeota archaeon]
MHLESVTESASIIKKEVPGLSDVAKELASVLKKSRFFLNKLFDICNKKEYSIDLTPEEQNEISLKVALVTSPDQVFQYARVVQLVFQLNYFAKCYDKALKSNMLPSVVIKEAKSMYKKIENFRSLIEKEYVSSI